MLLRIVADYGHADTAAADAAYAAGVAIFGKWASGPDTDLRADQRIDALDHALDVLQVLKTGGRQTLLKAISAVVTHDTQLTVSEAELIRVICATLDCPLPPILVFKRN
jgi:hypothetical protein